jgi:hypothetical protein
MNLSQEQAWLETKAWDKFFNEWTTIRIDKVKSKAYNKRLTRSKVVC